jgi:hypothetical protein
MVHTILIFVADLLPDFPARIFELVKTLKTSAPEADTAEHNNH